MPEWSEKLLGTIVKIKMPSQHSFLFPKLFSEFSRIEDAYSRFIDNSELSRLNAHLGGWQDAGDEMLWLLSAAEKFHGKTDGNFDITLKEPLEKLGYDKQHSFKEKKMAAAPGRNVDGGILIDAGKKRVLLRKQIDFGGFGKGYAIDCAAKILDKAKVRHYCINAGGDVYAKRGEGMEPWEILLEHPDNPENAIGKMQLDGNAIAGSAANRRRWGEGLHHLINAKTLRPSLGCKAIFVVANTGIGADAYATAIFTAGFEGGIALSLKLPVEMLLISSKNKMYKSPGFSAEIFG